MDGYIDDVLVLGRALSQVEIQSYMEVLPGLNVADLKGMWTFNEGQGARVFDKTLNYNHGDIQGGSWATCNNSDACNYVGLADYNDGSCDLPLVFYDCNEFCLNDTDNDSVCDELEIIGCQNELACNYNSSATDSGECIYIESNCQVCIDGAVIDNDSNEDGECDVPELFQHNITTQTAYYFIALATINGV